jgi:hypothetical protein
MLYLSLISPKHASYPHPPRSPWFYNNIWWKYKLWSSSLCNFLQSSVIPFLSTLFWNIKLYSSLNVTDQLPQLHKKKHVKLQIFVLIFTLLDNHFRTSGSSSAIVDSASPFRVFATLLLLLIVESLKIRRWTGLQRHTLIPSFVKIGQLVQELKERTRMPNEDNRSVLCSLNPLKPKLV